MIEIATLGIDVDSGKIKIGREELAKFGAAANRAANDAESAGRRASRGFSDVATTIRMVNSAIAAVGLYQSVRKIVEIGDEYANVHARLKLVTNGTAQLAAAEAGLFSVAQKTGVAYTETANLYAKVAKNAEALGLSQKQLLDFTEITNQAIQVSGASASEAAGGVRQLGQALASGVLRGDEFNSLAENMPRLRDAIAQGIGVSVGELRKLAAEGKLTSSVVAQALLSQKDVIEREFSQMPITVGRAWMEMENTAKKAIASADMTPLVGSIRELTNTLNDPAVISGLGSLASGAIKTAEYFTIAASKTAEMAKNIGEIAAKYSTESTQNDVLSFAANPNPLKISNLAFSVGEQVINGVKGVERSTKEAAPSLAEFQRGLEKITKPASDLAAPLRDLNDEVIPFVGGTRAAADAASEAAKSIANKANRDAEAAKAAEDLAKKIANGNDSLRQQIKELDIQLGLMSKGVAAEEAATRAKYIASGLDRTLINQYIAKEKVVAQYNERQEAELELLDVKIEHLKELAQLQGQIGIDENTIYFLQRGFAPDEARSKAALESLRQEIRRLENVQDAMNGMGDDSELQRKRLELIHLENEERIRGIAEARDLAISATQAQAEAQQRAADDMNRALTDAIFRAFESGKNFAQAFGASLQNYFSTLVLRPQIEALAAPIGNAINSAISGSILGTGTASLGAGIGGIANGVMAGMGGGFTVGGTVYNSAGQIVGIGNASTGAFNFASSPFGGAAIAGGLGYLGGSLLAGHGSFRDDTGNYTGIGAAVGNMIVPGIGAVVGAALGALASGIRGQWRESGKDVSVTIANGILDATVTTTEQRKRLGRSTKYRSSVDEALELDKSLGDAFASVENTLRNAAAHIGLSAGELNASVSRSITGLSGEELQKQLTGLIDDLAGDLVTRLVPGLKDMQKSGESLMQTFVRVVNQTTLLRDSLHAFGNQAQLTVEQINDIFVRGGDGFASNLQAFNDAFLSDGQKLYASAFQLSQTFNELGLTLPQTRQQLLDLIATLDPTSGAFAGVINAQGQLQSYFGLIERQNQAQISALNEQIQAGEKLLSIAKGLRDYVAGLRLSDLGPGDAETRSREALARFRELQGLAAGGDMEAAAQLQNAAQTAIQLAREAYASSDAYQAVFREVTGGIDQVAGLLEADQTVANLVGLRQQVKGLQSSVVGAIQDAATIIARAIAAAQAAAQAAAAAANGGGSTGTPSTGAGSATTPTATPSPTQTIRPVTGTGFNNFRTGAEVTGASFVSPRFRFADGGAFDQGIVQRPTYFNVGQMGEAGPEAIIPLRRASNGALGVASDPETVKHLAALVRLQSAANQQLIERLDSIDRRIGSVEKRARLAAQEAA